MWWWWINWGIKGHTSNNKTIMLRMRYVADGQACIKICYVMSSITWIIVNGRKRNQTFDSWINFIVHSNSNAFVLVVYSAWELVSLLTTFNDLAYFMWEQYEWYEYERVRRKGPFLCGDVTQATCWPVTEQNLAAHYSAIVRWEQRWTHK